MQSNSQLKPRIIDVQNVSPVQARVTMEPFERGFGHTLGNALRRVLLSSLPGCAPTQVSIKGVLHEYSTLDGVREDVVDLVLNLKGVVFKLHNRANAVLRLVKEGEGPILAGDIEDTHDVEIINPEHVIGHLAPGGSIEMEIRVEQGRGYVPANARPEEESNKVIGRIPLDASFSPVRRVSYQVESARVTWIVWSSILRLTVWSILKRPSAMRRACWSTSLPCLPIWKAPILSIANRPRQRWILCCCARSMIWS